MAVYKVPQDVEADDKLIGPFSFRQFIYLIVVAISCAGAFGLSKVFIPLAIIPLPFIIFFAALALPLRKDQPMETYLSAVVSFYFLKSRKRMWTPDGIDSFVTIIPPKDADKILTKELSEDEATKRLGYLADLVDTHGWSVRGAGVPVPDTSINDDLYYESEQANDMLDAGTNQAHSLDQKLQASNDAFHQNAITQMQQAGPATPVTPAAATQQPGVPPAAAGSLAPTDQYSPATPFNPMAKPATQPMEPVTKNLLQQDPLDAITYARMMAEEAEEDRNDETSAQKKLVGELLQSSTSATATPDDTMMNVRAQERARELATRDDISIQTLSEEANRMEERDKVLVEDGEVTISLR